MAKSTEDLVAVTSAILKRDLSSTLVKSWEGLRVSFVDPDEWQLNDVAADPIPELLTEQVSIFATPLPYAQAEHF